MKITKTDVAMEMQPADFFPDSAADDITEATEKRPHLVEFDASYFVAQPLSDDDYELFIARMDAAAQTILTDIYHTQRKPIQ